VNCWDWDEYQADVTTNRLCRGPRVYTLHVFTSLTIVIAVALVFIYLGDCEYEACVL
jgi:hypothetical protein